MNPWEYYELMLVTIPDKRADDPAVKIVLSNATGPAVFVADTISKLERFMPIMNAPGV